MQSLPIRVAGVVVTAALSLGAMPAATAAEPGVSATEVKIGAHLPLVGPASPGYKDVGPAIKAYFDYVNANGGINGRKVNFF